MNDMNGGFDARFLSIEARKCCKAEGFTPRRFEQLNSNLSAQASGPDDPEYPVLRIWNSKREIILTNQNLAYANMYL